METKLCLRGCWIFVLYYQVGDYRFANSGVTGCSPSSPWPRFCCSLVRTILGLNHYLPFFLCLWVVLWNLKFIGEITQKTALAIGTFLICYMVSSSLHFLIFSALSKFIFRFHRIILHEFSSLNDQSLCPPLFLINVGGNGALWARSRSTAAELGFWQSSCITSV